MAQTRCTTVRHELGNMNRLLIGDFKPVVACSITKSRNYENLHPRAFIVANSIGRSTDYKDTAREHHQHCFPTPLRVSTTARCHGTVGSSCVDVSGKSDVSASELAEGKILSEA